MKNFIFYAAILAGLFFGCTAKDGKKPVAVISKTLGTINTDSIAPPVVTMITAANTPKVIKAAPPTIVPLSYPYGVGVPSFTNYDIADGMPDSYVASSTVDKFGNLWFATAAGISKYDGINFTNYNTENGLSSNIIRRLFADSKNNIWIATEVGISIFDGKYFTSLNKDNLSSDYFETDKIFESSDGILWFATSQGLFKYELKSFTRFTSANGVDDGAISNVIQDKNGNMLISSFKSIMIYDGKSFVPYTNLPVNSEGKSPFLLYCDSKGNIWFDDRLGGLGKYDGKEIKIYNKKDGYTGDLRRRSRNAFLEDISGNYWIGGIDGLTKFDGNKFFKFTTIDGLPANSILSLTEDNDGNIWAATQNNGISKISSSYLSKMEIPPTGFRDIAFDKFGSKWVTGSEGLGKLNSDYIAYYAKELKLRIYNGLFIDHAGNRWFSGRDSMNVSGNLVKFDGSEYTIFGKDQGVALGYINHITQDDSNNIWFSGFLEGVIKFDGSSFSSYGTAQGLTSNEIYSIFHDSQGNSWFGSRDAGVFKYDGQYFTNYTTIDGLPHNFINDIAEDALGNIWLATDGGAAKFEGSSFTSYRAIDGLDNAIGDVEYDSVNNAIWFSTSIGLASLDMKRINDKNPIFQHYNKRTGFALPYIFRIALDNKGVVWGDGIDNVIFDFKSFKDNKPIPLQIKNIKLDNKHISWNTLRKGAYPVGTKDSLTAINEMALKFGKSFSEEDFQTMSEAFGKVRYDSITGSDFIPADLVLPIKNNNISFEFGSISTSFAKAVRYQYKLEGYDKNWSELSTKTEASFGNMSEGKYTFQVKALSPFGSWSETSYSFKVLPPWYRAWWAYLIYILVFASLAWLFVQSQKRKAAQKEREKAKDRELSQAKEIEKAFAQLGVAHEDLKSTQAQLIQSEKMASLGELTAGIAHEIQNPLNFVNNFSEVNKELLVELKDEIKKGNLNEVDAIADDVISNEEKINHHGKRADAIVKGMLQHSRTSRGQKELTDINALADEYLRLAYHGLRAKDKSFNARMKTDFDASIGNINIIPQDIGRVILNLINNAFYVVNEKSKQGIAAYEPTVEVSTKKEGVKVLINVKDNGSGIPDHIKDKIFQPFFTTKPTGQGTGLGLSLSYDIVKAHGGELALDSTEGVGTEFTIKIPIA